MSSSSSFWFLKSCILFEKIPDVELGRLENVCRQKEFSKKEIIYAPPDEANSVFVVARGRIRLYHLTSDGKESVLTFIDPGEIFGELSVLEGGRHEEFAEAMEQSLVVRIPIGVLDEILERHPDISLKLTRLIGLRRRNIERRLKSLLFRSNRERLLHLLLELAEKYGKSSQLGMTIGIRLSQQEYASIIGSTRESVTLLMKEFETEGILLVERREVILRDPKHLATTLGINWSR